ncbi:MAG: BamA/TamA family outer membrane protein [Acidobacteria bacterium]|nr:BamA/TamA family outer membrane protein [Acidobacteriota bacterium]
MTAELSAQTLPAGQPVAAVVLDLDGRALSDLALVGLIDTKVGQPLALPDVRESIVHLMGLGRFEDVRVHAVPDGRGLTLRYELRSLRTVKAIELRGHLGLPERELRDAVVERFGASPPVGRAGDIALALREFLAQRGFDRATVAPRQIGAGERSAGPVLVMDVDAGLRTVVGGIAVQGPIPRETVLHELDVHPGAPYDATALLQQVDRYARKLKADGHYRATVESIPRSTGDGRTVDLAIRIDLGPVVRVAFEGDPLPVEALADLVPIARERSADQDLLEDSKLRLERYLRGQGYRDPRVDFSSRQEDHQLTIVFNIRRGPRFRVGDVRVSGNQSLALDDLRPSILVRSGEPFVDAQLESTRAALADHYQRAGYADVAVAIGTSLRDPARSASPGLREIDVRITIDERVRTVVGQILIEGSASVSEGVLREAMLSKPGAPFYRPQVVRDVDRVLLEYRDRGYQLVAIDPDIRFSEDRRIVDVRFLIREGPQIFVDHVLIVGNTRTSADTIERQLLVKPGQPLSITAVLESRRRLSALGLFRRIDITELQHGTETRRDILVTVEEAPVSSFGFGGGVEGGERLRRTTESPDRATERFEFAPRGFVEIGRRNLWGKNRSVNLYTRVSVRPPAERLLPDGETKRGLSFREYRVVGVFREPDIFGTDADGQITGVLEQAVRSSFNFRRRSARLELAQRLTPRVSVVGRYSFDRAELFDEQFNTGDRLLIDRIFPNVRLSSIAGSMLRDTRDDALEPTKGTLIGIDGQLTARAIGAEVGFSKTFLQGFTYRRLPGRRPIVFAAGARLGLADGFAREVPATGPEGTAIVEIVEDVPASERFFAGGDTTVRGFVLDRLGAAGTIDVDGFPRGGNALMILNAEIRLPVWRDLGAVGFIDAGNVFAQVDDFDFGEIRGAVGFGLRYRSPVGPIRVDLGFALDRREIGGRPERLPVLHISIGQAF